MKTIDVENLFAAVMRRDAGALRALFAGGRVRLSLPSFGLISSERIFRMLLAKIAVRFEQLKVEARCLNVGHAGRVLVAEYDLSYPFFDEERNKEIRYSTPTAIVFDLDEDGLATCATVYTGFDKFVGKEIIRPALYDAEPLLSQVLPAPVAAAYEAMKPERLTEPCRVHLLPGRVCVEENVLFTEGEICTPQAHLSVFVLAPDGSVAERLDYGEIVWDFKLWPTLY